MVTARAVTGSLLAAIVGLSACSGSSDPVTSAPTSTVVAITDLGDDDSGDSAGGGRDAAAASTTVEPIESTTTSTSATTTTTTTTEVLRPGVVALDGSVEGVLAELDEASNFAVGVAGWLAAVPGQEGVLRNSRGITLFVPVDAGFPTDDRDAAFADQDLAAITLSDHLRVGALEILDETITVASGAEYVVSTDGEDTLVGGRRVIAMRTTTNGVIYLIDGPLDGTNS